MFQENFLKKQFSTEPKITYWYESDVWINFVAFRFRTTGEGKRGVADDTQQRSEYCNRHTIAAPQIRARALI